MVVKSRKYGVVCQLHRDRFGRAELATDNGCEEFGCTLKHYANGHCYRHFKRWRRLSGYESSPKPSKPNMELLPTRRSWYAARQRTTNPKSDNWRYYGGRGITMCDRWLDKKQGFANFLADMGIRPEGTSIDRMNVNGNYEPANCRWATRKEQRANRNDSK